MNLYDAAKKTCHDLGLVWIDPRDNSLHKPPRKKRRKKCLRCGGTGTTLTPSMHMRPCPQCNGEGYLEDNAKAER
jgi:DnaJ-class molecular chaperone